MTRGRDKTSKKVIKWEWQIERENRDRSVVDSSAPTICGPRFESQAHHPRFYVVKICILRVIVLRKERERCKKVRLKKRCERERQRKWIIERKRKRLWDDWRKIETQINGEREKDVSSSWQSVLDVLSQTWIGSRNNCLDTGWNRALGPNNFRE